MYGRFDMVMPSGRGEVVKLMSPLHPSMLVTLRMNSVEPIKSFGGKETVGDEMLKAKSGLCSVLEAAVVEREDNNNNMIMIRKIKNALTRTLNSAYRI